MRAIILAAGQGTRLRPLTEHTPKCLLPIAGSNVLLRLINQLKRYELENIVVVVGYRKEQVKKQIRDAFGSTISIVENDRYHEDINIFSLWLGAAEDTSPFVVFEADTIFEDRCLDFVFARSMKRASMWCTYGFFQRGQIGGIVKVDSTGRIIDMRVVKGCEDHYKNYKILLGILRVGEEEVPVFLKLLSEACTERIDQPYIAPWAKHLEQLPCYETDLTSTKVCTFNTINAYYSARRIFGD